jgi:translocation and assembly module TamB
VLGHGLDRTSGTDFGALQAASAALLGQQGKPITATIAQSIGLDDISIKSATGTARGNASGTPDTAGQVVTVGKRLSDRFSLVYEQGLTVATNALRSVQLTRSRRCAPGRAISGVGVYFGARSWWVRR